MNTKTLLSLGFAASLAAPQVMAQQVTAQNASPLELWADKPAQNTLNQAFLLGNGSIGAMMSGGETEQLTFNDISLWTGDENPSGDYKTMGSYQLFGNLLVGFEATVKNRIQVSVPSGHRPHETQQVVETTVDGNPATKWVVAPGANPIIWQAQMPANSAPVTAYTLTSANDVPARDPREWEFSGSQDGQNWTTLNKQTAQAPFGKRGESKTFRFTNTTAFLFYRLTFSQNNGDPLIQLAEIALGDQGGADSLANYRRELNVDAATARTTFTRVGRCTPNIPLPSKRWISRSAKLSPPSAAGPTTPMKIG